MGQGGKGHETQALVSVFAGWHIVTKCDRFCICCPDSCTSNGISVNKVKEGPSWKDMIEKVGPQRFCKLLSFEYDFILIKSNSMKVSLNMDFSLTLALFLK